MILKKKLFFLAALLKKREDLAKELLKIADVVAPGDFFFFF